MNEPRLLPAALFAFLPQLRHAKPRIHRPSQWSHTSCPLAGREGKRSLSPPVMSCPPLSSAARVCSAGTVDLSPARHATDALDSTLRQRNYVPSRLGARGSCLGGASKSPGGCTARSC